MDGFRTNSRKRPLRIYRDYNLIIHGELCRVVMTHWPGNQRYRYLVHSCKRNMLQQKMATNWHFALRRQKNEAVSNHPSLYLTKTGIWTIYIAAGCALLIKLTTISQVQTEDKGLFALMWHTNPYLSQNWRYIHDQYRCSEAE